MQFLLLLFIFRFNKYYGVVGFMDWLHDTDVEKSVKEKWKLGKSN